MNVTEKLDKSKIHSVVGKYNKNNTFQCIDYNIIDCISYREINRLFTDSDLVCVNIKWVEALSDWVIFQCIDINGVKL